MKKMNYLLLILCVFLFLCGCKKTDNANLLTNQTDTIDSEKLEESKKETTKTETYEAYSGLWSVDGKSDSEKNDTKTELSKENIQQRIYDKYYALWSDDELLAAMKERRVYLDQCSFYPKVEGYMEQIREVRDGSNVIEPLYYTDMKNYQKEDFENIPALMLRLAKNEIYARRGYIFQDSDLNNYFMGQLWYEPSIRPDDFDSSVFNEYEISNLQLLVDLE